MIFSFDSVWVSMYKSLSMSVTAAYLIGIVAYYHCCEAWFMHPEEKEPGSEKRPYSLFLVTALYIANETHFVRLVTLLRFCTNEGAGLALL